MAQTVATADVKTIILACEAGMGSSLMVVSQMKKKLKKAKVTDVTVVHKPARAIPADAQLIMVHNSLAGVVRRSAPDAVIVTFKMFLNDPTFDKVVNAFANNGELENTVG